MGVLSLRRAIRDFAVASAAASSPSAATARSDPQATAMRFPWASRQSVGDTSAAKGGSDSLTLDGATASEASISPMVSAHVQLHTRTSLSALSARPSAASATPREDVAAMPDDHKDPSGKDKPVPTPVIQAVAAFLRHNWISVIYSAVALSLVVLLTYLSFFAASMDDGAGTKPEFLSCRSWAFGDGCGLWGINCRPFQTEWSAIRCRSRCTLDQSSSLSVWGTDKYHANSRICRAAVHAGVIGANGGCALMRYSGPANAFAGSTANGVTTQSYEAWFPKTFEFKAAPSHYCTDLTWTILAVSVALSAGFALLPRTNPGMLFGMLIGSGFFYVRLVGQPQSVDYADIAVTSFGEVFVLLAASYWLYSVAPLHTFAQWSDKTLRQRVLFFGVCYVLPYYVLLNMNMFEYVPWLNFNLGGYEKLHANAGTYIVIALLVLVMVYCAYRFLRELYRENLWQRLVLWYGVVAAVVLLSWALFSSTDPHLHHTMLGAMFLPLTRFPTPLAAVAQSALLGCFVQGYAAWGWHSYLNTIPTYLTIEKPKAAVVANITQTGANFSWAPVEGVDGYSLRLNKVEVYRGTETNALIEGLQPNLTYFVTVAGVAAWGTDSQDGPKANFTTLPVELIDAE